MKLHELRLQNLIYIVSEPWKNFSLGRTLEQIIHESVIMLFNRTIFMLAGHN